MIFDPEKVHDLANYAEPNQLSVGMAYVFVNGVPVIADGKMTNALPGKILYRAGMHGAALRESGSFDPPVRSFWS